MIEIKSNYGNTKVEEKVTFNVCNKCSSSDLYCNEDLNIKNGYMRCDKLYMDLENKYK